MVPVTKAVRYFSDVTIVDDYPVTGVQRSQVKSGSVQRYLGVPVGNSWPTDHQVVFGQTAQSECGLENRHRCAVQRASPENEHGVVFRPPVPLQSLRPVAFGY